MTLEHHAFISYAHIDNQPLPTEKEGWVSLFHEALSQLLSVRLGANADILRDEKLNGNDIFSDEIVEQFRKAATLIRCNVRAVIRSAPWLKRWPRPASWRSTPRRGDSRARTSSKALSVSAGSTAPGNQSPNSRRSIRRAIQPATPSCTAMRNSAWRLSGATRTSRIEMPP